MLYTACVAVEDRKGSGTEVHKNKQTTVRNQNAENRFLPLFHPTCHFMDLDLVVLCPSDTTLLECIQTVIKRLACTASVSMRFSVSQVWMRGKLGRQ